MRYHYNVNEWLHSYRRWLVRWIEIHTVFNFERNFYFILISEEKSQIFQQSPANYLKMSKSNANHEKIELCQNNKTISKLMPIKV